MARITIEARIAKIRRDREALEKKEQSLLAQSTDRAIKKILTIMKDSDLTEAQVVKALAAAGATAGAPEKGSKAAKAAKATAKGVKPAFAPKAKGGKVAPKYRNPENAEQTWTGRGIPPTWARLMREAGRLDEAVIQK
jgi:DNA-binding protein H-NS